ICGYHTAVLPLTTHGWMDRRTGKQLLHIVRLKKRRVRLERFALARLMTNEIAGLNVQTIINDHEPSRALNHLTFSTRSEIAQHRHPTRLRRSRQRPIILRIEERKREHTGTRKHPPKRANRFNHLVHIDMRKN